MVARSLFLSLALAEVLAGPARAQALDDDPRSLEARKACTVGEVDKGVKLLVEYFASTDDTTAIYNIARCYELNGLTEKARLHFREYLRKARDLGAQDRKEIEDHLRELEARPRPAEDRARPGPASPSIVETRPEPAASPGRPLLRRTGLVLVGAGALALGAGAVFGLKVAATNEELRKANDWGTFDGKHSSGQRAETLQWIFLGTGAAAVVAGGACYFLGLRPVEGRPLALLPWAAPGGVGASVRGRY